MSIKEKIAQIKDKGAKLAVKATAVATLLGGAGTAVSCSENNRDIDENGNKVERVEGEKTSVVFRTTHNSDRFGDTTDILFEDGKSITNGDRESRFLEPGDTVTYEEKVEKYNFSNTKIETNIKAVRYKGGNGKQVNFGKIGKLGKDITD